MNVININGGKVHNGTEFGGIKGADCMTHANTLRYSARQYIQTDAPVNCKSVPQPHYREGRSGCSERLPRRHVGSQHGVGHALHLQG